VAARSPEVLAWSRTAHLAPLTWAERTMDAASGNTTGHATYALDLTPLKEETGRKDKMGEKKRKVLDQLERGEITAEEAKTKLGVPK